MRDLDNILNRPSLNIKKDFSSMQITSTKIKEGFDSREGLVITSLQKLEEWMEEMLEFETSEKKIENLAFKLTNFKPEEISSTLSRAKSIKELKRIYQLDAKKLTELKKYVQKSVKKGISKEEMVADLTSEGWSKEFIEPFVISHYE